MIHVVVQNGKLVLKQLLREPSVYLDHYALRKISEDPHLSARLSGAIRAKNGTIALSLINRVEFIGVSNDQQALVAENLLSDLWPQLFLMDVDPARVAQREISLLPTTTYPDGSLACDDQALLGAFTSRINLNAPGVRWNLGEMFRAFPPPARTRADLVKIVRDGRQAMAAVHQGRRTPEYREKRRNFRRKMRATGICAPRATGPLFTAMLEIFDQDRPLPSDNDFFDFLHACVPSSYCTFVMLDGGWRHIVDRVRKDLTDDNIMTPIAQAFSEREGGMERFFTALEQYPASPPLPCLNLTDALATSTQHNPWG
jgi:hypothetical protein